jgi:glycosyltransferase involved in cell wall biosynthesis
MAGLGVSLMDALRELGAGVVPSRWGRHADTESALASVVGRYRDLRRVRRLLVSQEFDVLFVNTAHDRRAILRDVPLLLCTRHLAHRTVVQFHGSFSQELGVPGHHLLKAASRWMARHTDAILMLSREETGQWRAFEPRGIYMAVTNPYVQNPALGGMLRQDVDGARDQHPVVLFVGRLLAAKGIYDLVEAAGNVVQSVDFRLRMAGEGRDGPELARRIREAELDERVRLLGHVQAADLAKEYGNATVFVLPSHSEGFATVLAEAMDAGLPIITTGIRGAADHLKEGENALLVPPGDSARLAAALERLLTEPDLRRAMSRANSMKVREFAPSVVARDYMRFFEWLLSAGGQRRVSD